MARRPSTRISRLTTVASTGRRMKMSVKRLIRLQFERSTGTGGIIPAVCYLVVDQHWRAVVQLDLSGGNERYRRA